MSNIVVSSNTISISPSSVLLSPTPITPTVFSSTSATVPYIVSSVNILIYYTVANSISSVTLNGVLQTSLVLTSNPVSIIQLALVGSNVPYTNVITINSVVDGLYTISIIRSPQDVSGFYVQCSSYNSTESSSVQSFTPAFTSGVFLYNLSVAADYYNCNLQLFYTSANTITILSPPSNLLSAPASSVFTTTPYPLALNAATLLYINSTLDGVYTLSIMRANWDVKNISILCGKKQD